MGLFLLLSEKEEIYTTGRELTRSELRDIRHLVSGMCANYDSHYKECLPLDGACYMTCIAYTDSPLCKYFKAAILPLDPALEAVFSGEYTGASIKNCVVCGKGIASGGRTKYCPACARRIHRRQKTESERKRRLSVDK